MSTLDKTDRFLTALDELLPSAWCKMSGCEGRPFLTFSMCPVYAVPEDDAGMRLEIQRFFEEPASESPVNLHLYPEMFEVGGTPNKKNMTVVRLENPTHLAVFTAVESYYRDMGCPDTDKQFVECLIKMGSKLPDSDVTVFMGS